LKFGGDIRMAQGLSSDSTGNCHVSVSITSIPLPSTSFLTYIPPTIIRRHTVKKIVIVMDVPNFIIVMDVPNFLLLLMFLI
jgi:hypothetical protein